MAKYVEEMVVLQVTCTHCAHTQTKQKTLSIDHPFFDQVEAGDWVQVEGFEINEIPVFQTTQYVCPTHRVVH